MYAGTNDGLFDIEFAASTTSTSITTSSTTTPLGTTARWMLDAALFSTICAEQTVPAGVTRKSDRAVDVIERAAMTAGKRARKLLKRTKKVRKNADTKATRWRRARA